MPVQRPRIPIGVAGSWPNRPPFRRAARWDGVVPIRATEGLDCLLGPDELRDMMEYLRPYRGGSGYFDVVATWNTSQGNQASDAELLAAYRDAGATWWLENVNPVPFCWRWSGDWPLDAMHRRITAGPPEI